MEKFIEKMEKIIDNFVNDFETKPIKTSIKLLLFYIIFKKIYAFAKDF